MWVTMSENHWRLVRIDLKGKKPPFTGIGNICIRDDVKHLEDASFNNFFKNWLTNI